MRLLVPATMFSVVLLWAAGATVQAQLVLPQNEAALVQQHQYARAAELAGKDAARAKQDAARWAAQARVLAYMLAQGKPAPADDGFQSSAVWWALGSAWGLRQRGNYKQAEQELQAALAKVPAGDVTLKAQVQVALGYVQLEAESYAAASKTLAAVEAGDGPTDAKNAARIGRLLIAAWQGGAAPAIDSLSTGYDLKQLAKHPEGWRLAVAKAHNLSEKRQNGAAQRAWRAAIGTTRKQFGKDGAGYAEVLAAAATDIRGLGDQKTFVQLSHDLDDLLANREKRLAAWEKEPAKAKQVRDDYRITLAAAEAALANDNPEKARALVNRAIRVLRLTGDTNTWQHARAYGLYAKADLVDGRHTPALMYQTEALRFAQPMLPEQSLLLADAQGTLAAAQAGRFLTDEAAATYQSAISVSTANRNATHAEHIALLLGLADVHYGQRKFRAAEAVLTEALKQQRARDGDRSLAVALNADRLGLLNLEEGNYGPAATNFDLAEQTLARVPGDWFLQQANIIEHKALLAQARGDFKLAETLYFDAMRIRRKRLGIKEEANTGSTTKLAQLYISQGRYTDAMKLLKQSVSAYEKLKRTDEAYTTAVSSLADLYMKTGQYAEAEATARKARDIVRTNWKEGSVQFANTGIQLATVVTAMGRYREASELLTGALLTYRTVYSGSNINTAKLLTQLATNANLRGKPLEAEKLLADALQQAETAVGVKHPDYAAIQLQLAQTFIATRRYEQAVPLLVQVLATQEGLVGRNHPDYLRAEAIQAQLYTLQRNYAAADRNYQHVLSGWNKSLGTRHPDYSFYLADYAHLQFKQGNTGKARKSYEVAMAGLLGLVDKYFPALSEGEKTDFWTKISQKLDNYYLFALDGGQKDPQLLGAAYDLRLRTKALLLTQSAGLRNRIGASGDEELKSLFEQWQGRREYLAKLYTLSKADLKTAGVSIEGVERQVADLERQLAAKADFFSAGDTLQATWQRVAAKLASTEAAVEILRLQAGELVPSDSIVYAALVLTPNARAPKAVVLPAGNLMDRRYLLQYARGVSNRFDDRESYVRFWKPIEEATAGATRLLVSTDGVYNTISLSALRRTDGNFVMDVQEIRLLANTRDLLVNRKRNFFDGKSALLVGDPIFGLGAASQNSIVIPQLEGTEREIANINQTLTSDGWSTQVLTKAEASELLLKQRANPKLLHIATHGFFYPMGESDGVETASVLGIAGNQAAQNPLLRSGLLLTGASSTLNGDRTAAASSATADDNGVITAYEVMNLDLTNTELVVLSACETGLGEVKNGEGVYGLQRAFTVAGAKAVVMSLWRVNDTVTQELVSRFYQYWVGKNTDLYSAFRAAQMDVRAQFPESYYWGAFVITGN